MRKHSSISANLATVACVLTLLWPLAPPAFGQRDGRVELGHLQTGANVLFTRSASGEWGMEIAGGPAPRILQPKPARIEVYRADNDIQQLTAGYQKIRKTASGMDAQAEIVYGKDVVFRVHDKWSVHSTVLSLERNVTVKGSAPGGFYSAIDFSVDRSLTWPDINFHGSRRDLWRSHLRWRSFSRRNPELWRPSPFDAGGYSGGAAVCDVFQGRRVDSYARSGAAW